MDVEEEFPSKVSGVQSLSSSVHSNTDKNGHSDDVSRSLELVEDFQKCSPKMEPQISSEKDPRKLNSSKARTTEPSTCNKVSINEEPKRSSCFGRHPSSSKKKNRKGENPVRVRTPCLEYSNPDSWICKNPACRALLSAEDAFCKRCSCCICHLFDDNKDPSLWFVCTSEPGQGDSCGMSSHVECALQHEKAGVLNLGQLMHLDGSYCCASCGKVSGILECWKKQLAIAKDSRRVDALCYRIFMSYRLLDGTSRFKNLHEIVRYAKTKLETEVGPVNGVLTKMARGLAGRLSVSGDVQRLCSLAIQKADEWLASNHSTNSSCSEDSLPAACKFLFEEVTSSSILMLLVEPSNAAEHDIKGFKLWYCKTAEGTHPRDPVCVFPRTRRRVSVSNLLPCTQYSFRVISYTDDGDIGHSEARCFTHSVEILRRRSGSAALASSKDGGGASAEDDSSVARTDQTAATPQAAPGFKVRDLGKVLHLARDHAPEQFCETSIVVKPECLEEYRGSLDLNVVSVPDLNEDALIPLAEAGQKSPAGPYGGLPDTLLSGKRSPSMDTEARDCDSTLVSGSAFLVQATGGGPGCLGDSFEYCVKVIRWLECEGHIDPGFRMKLLTWFSLRSTEKERRVVTTFIQAMADDPESLAGQLLDSFSDLVSNKRPKTVLCSKLWH